MIYLMDLALIKCQNRVSGLWSVSLTFFAHFFKQSPVSTISHLPSAV